MRCSPIILRPFGDFLIVRGVWIDASHYSSPYGVAIRPRSGSVLHGARFSVDGIKVDRRVHGRQQRAVLHMQGNRFIFELAHKIGLQVPLQTWRIQSIEHALQRRMSYRTDQIERRFLELPDWVENPLRVLERPSVAPHNAT